MKKTTNRTTYLTTFSTLTYSEKPQGSEIAKIQSNCIETNITIKDLAGLISSGSTFFTSNFINDKHRKDTYRDSHLIVLDSDDGKITHAAFKKFCKKNNIEPNIFYKSWSDSSRKNKFHAVWLIDKVEDIQEIESLSKYLYFLFSKAFKDADLDKSMYKPTQPWGGTNKEVNFYHENKLNFHNVTSALLSLYKSNHSRIKKELQEFTNISNLTNDENGKLIIELSEIKKQSYNFEIDLTNSSADTLINNCRLVRELTTYKQPYYEHSLNFNVLCNLVNVKKGRELYLKLSSINGSKKTSKYENDFNVAKNYKPVKCSKYCPYSNICRFGTKTMAYASKTDAYKKNSHKPSYIKQIDLDTAYKQLSKILDKSVLSHKNKEKTNIINNKQERIESAKTLDIIEVGTGVGKTHKIIELIKKEACKYDNIKPDLRSKSKELLKGFIYAAPTHALAEQTYKELLSDYKVKLYDIVYIKPRPTVLDKKTENEINDLEQDGFYELSVELQKDYYREIKLMISEHERGTIDLKEDYSKFTNYIAEVKEWLEVRKDALKAKVIISTHAYLKTMDLKNYKYIDIVLIDEDITMSCLPQHNIKINDLYEIKTLLQRSTYEYYKRECYFEDVEDIIQKILDSDYNKIYTYNSRKDLWYNKRKQNKIIKVLGINNKKLKALIELKKENKLRIRELLAIDSFYKSDNYLHIQTVNKIDLHDKKCIVLSATPAPAELYENIFGTKVETYKIDKVKFKGKLYQNADFKCYKKDLLNDDYIGNISEYLMEDTMMMPQEEDYKIITFKDQRIQEALNENGFSQVMTFGATAGLNSLKGQNFAVIGTYYINPNSVNLLAGALMKENTVSNIDLIRNYKVKFQEVEQLIATFDEGFKRDYHLWQCWQNMEQSIGRARLVRENCVVILLSAMIHPLAIQVSKYED